MLVGVPAAAEVAVPKVFGPDGPDGGLAGDAGPAAVGLLPWGLT